jgi:hypothetical protein
MPLDSSGDCLTSCQLRYVDLGGILQCEGYILLMPLTHVHPRTRIVHTSPCRRAWLRKHGRRTKVPTVICIGTKWNSSELSHADGPPGTFLCVLHDWVPTSVTDYNVCMPASNARSEPTRGVRSDSSTGPSDVPSVLKSFSLKMAGCVCQMSPDQIVK